MARGLTGIALALVLVHAGIAVAAEPLPGCRAARTPPAYDGALELPDATIERLEAYRARWRRACDRKPENGSLHGLLLQATQIEADFALVFRRENERWDDAKGPPEARWQRAEAVHRFVGKELPAFVPGFRGSHIDWEYFSPSLGFFREHAALGDDEDRVFLESHIPLRGSGGDDLPWLERIWDYGGCTRFGEFDWIAELARIEALREQLQRDVYRATLAAYESRLFEDLTPRYSLCVCQDPESAVADLERVSQALAARNGPEERRAAIDAAAARMRAGETSLRSHRDGTCGGH